MLLDIKYTLRLLLKAPKFAAMTLTVLVGGLSISLFTFSFLYTVLYKDLPLPQGDTALAFRATIDGQSTLITPYEFTQLKDQQTVLAEFGAFDRTDVRISINDGGLNLNGVLVDEGFFEFSRTLPILGRTIVKTDTELGATPVAVISYFTWQNTFAANADIIGSTILANNVVTQVIGVMPEGYRFPMSDKIWLPLYETVTSPGDRSNYWYAYGRLKPEIDLEQAELALGNLLDRTYQSNVTLYNLPEGRRAVRLLTFAMAQTDGQGNMVFMFLSGIAWMILLLACINVGNLLLARSIDRQKETAIRAALGAPHKRLINLLMLEGIIITTLGGVLSVLLVGAALDYTNVVLHSWMPDGMLFWWQWGMDRETLLMAFVFTVATILLSSFLPAWRSANQDINTTLRDGTRGVQGKKAGRLSKLLVTTQIFLVAILMLIGSVTGYVSQKLINLDMGDDYNNVMTARTSLPSDKYPLAQQQIGFYQELMSRIESHPTVSGVAANNWLGELPLLLKEQGFSSEENAPKVDVISVIGETDIIGINLVAGRYFNHLDSEDNQRVAIISQSMANRYWPGEPALGENIKVIMPKTGEQSMVIVGIVTDRLNPRTLIGKIDTADEIYVSGLQYMSAFQIIYYRIQGSLIDSDELFYQALYEVDRSVDMFYAVQPAQENRSKMHDIMRLTSNITFGTGFFALLLALVGIYGLTANSIAQRTHEIGIRRAIGASDSNIMLMFLKQGGKQLFTGLGLALVLFAFIATALHSVSAGTFPFYLYFILAGIVIVGLSIVVLLAILAPTKRAVKMEPSMALRYE